MKSIPYILITMAFLLILVTTLAVSDDASFTPQKSNQDLLQDINKSVEKLKSNGRNLDDIESKLFNQKSEIEKTLEKYKQLENTINDNLNKIDELSSSIYNAKTNSKQIEDDIYNLQYKIDNNYYQIENPSTKDNTYYFIMLIILSNIFTILILKYIQK